MFKFPFGTMNELNLNWIIQKVKELADATGITKEKLSFLTPNGPETFDGSEPLTIDVQGVDTSGKLDKYEGGTNSIYGTLGSNQVNFPVPLPAERGGTGVTSLSDLETSMNLTGKYVGRKTTAGGLYAYGHNGSTEQEIPVEVSPAPAGIPYRDANSCVKTGVPQTDNDAATKKYVDDADADKLDKLTTANESVYSHNGNTQGEIATATANTSDTIVKRDSSGRSQFADPSANQDAATKKYVDDTIANTTSVDLPVDNIIVPIVDPCYATLKKNNKIVNVFIFLGIKSTGVTADQKIYDIATIPAGYRPVKDQQILCYINKTGADPECYPACITTSGSVLMIYKETGSPSGYQIGLSASYIVN